MLFRLGGAVCQLRCAAGAGCTTLGCAWSSLRRRPTGGRGMELFGPGQGWAQSHKSATPAVGGHADIELAVS